MSHSTVAIATSDHCLFWNHSLTSLYPLLYLSLSLSVLHSLLHTTWRPNTCKTERVYETQTYSYSYTYKKKCSRYSCQKRLVCYYCQKCLVCNSTGNCEGDLVNITRTKHECCEGFSRDPSVRRSGCPLGKCSAVHSQLLCTVQRESFVGANIRINGEELPCANFVVFILYVQRVYENLHHLNITHYTVATQVESAP